MNVWQVHAIMQVCDVPVWTKLKKGKTAEINSQKKNNNLE